jgi:hypothetical protein
MLLISTFTILLIVLIVLLVISLCLFLTTKHLKIVAKRKAAERYRGKGALLPIANIHVKQRAPMMQHPSMSFDDSNFRKSFYQYPSSPPFSSCLSVPEIRITFPDEDFPPQILGVPGQRTSQVVVVQIGESGAAYVTAPPPYEGFHDVDMSNIGGLKEKCWQGKKFLFLFRHIFIFTSGGNVFGIFSNPPSDVFKFLWEDFEFMKCRVRVTGFVLINKRLQP